MDWLRRHARRLLGRRGLSVSHDQDVVQEVCRTCLDTLAYTGGGAARSPRPLYRWMREVVRKLGRTRERDREARELRGRVDYWRALAGAARARHSREELLRRLERLTKLQRRVVGWYLDGVSVEEIRKKIGSTQRAVYQLLARARERLAEPREDENVQ